MPPIPELVLEFKGFNTRTYGVLALELVGIHTPSDFWYWST